jgi:radical SAM superfamily enzyme YgiQ (UPF0313 family)
MKAQDQKVMLIVPPRTILQSSVKRCCTPLGLGYIAGVLRNNGVETRILDSYAEGYNTEAALKDGYVRVGLEDGELVSQVNSYSPDVVGVTCGFTSEINNAMDVCRLVKRTNPGVTTVMGGLHPSNYPAETLNACPDIDYIVLREGEYRFLRLLNGDRTFDGLAIQATKTIIPPEERITDLDALPFPARDLMNMQAYLSINRHISPYPQKARTEQILTSRGCPGRCTFCTSGKFWGNKYRSRGPENVINEMKQLIGTYGVQEFQFTDDSMTLDRPRAMRIFDMMKPLDVVFCMANGVFVNSLDEPLIKKMSEAGCYQITFSVESGSEHSLRLMKKNVDLRRVKPLVDYSRSLGISSHATFVLGIPGETIGDIRQSFQFASDCGFDSASFFTVSPLPGSELYDQCREKGFLTDTAFDRMDFKSAKINNPDLSPECLERLIEDENSRFIRKYLFRHPLRFLRKYGRFIREDPGGFIKIFGRVT